MAPLLLLTKQPSLSLLWNKLVENHEQDLIIYRQAHQNISNRILHWMLIPVECWSALVILDVALLGPFLTSLVCIALGILSFFLCRCRHQHEIKFDITRRKRFVSSLALIFHVICSYSSMLRNAEYYSFKSRQQLIIFALVAWTMAWVLQFGVGHWMWEGNQPNVANRNEVSYQAMCTSVLIAWSS